MYIQSLDGTVLICLPLLCSRNKDKKCHPSDEKRNVVEQSLDQGFQTVRVETNKVLDMIAENKDSLNSGYEKVLSETKFVHDYLSREENHIPRAGAVVLGAMSGIIMGIRGGIFRKAFYGLIGTGIMGSICYPKETEEITQVALGEAKKGVSVAVNFAYGVKPGEKAPQINFPTIPTTVAELESSIGSALKAAKNLVFSDK